MPPRVAWFARPIRVAVDAAVRVRESGHPRSVADLSAMIKDAPYDFPLASEYLTTKYGERAPYTEVVAALGPRMDYDLRALRLARRYAKTDVERLTRSLASISQERP